MTFSNVFFRDEAIVINVHETRVYITYK